MHIQHTNRKSQVFYLHQGLTKKKKPKYFFSTKRDETVIDYIPEGFEIYESPSAPLPPTAGRTARGEGSCPRLRTEGQSAP